MVQSTRDRLGVIAVSVSVLRLDGTSINFSCQNYGENSVGPGKNPPATRPQRDQPILTEVALTKLAFDPDLSWFPPSHRTAMPSPPPS